MGETVPQPMTPPVSPPPPPPPSSVPQREKFTLSDPSMGKLEQEAYIESLYIYQHEMTELIKKEMQAKKIGRRVSMAEAGSNAGKSFVRLLSAVQSHPDSVVSMATRHLESTMPKKNAYEFLSGFSGEYAFAHLMATKHPDDIYYPLTEAQIGQNPEYRDEDRFLKADWVVKKPGQKDAYIQVKTLRIDEDALDSAQLVFDLRAPKALENMRSQLEGYLLDQDQWVGGRIDEAEAMIQANGGSDKRLIYCFVPSNMVHPSDSTFVDKEFIEDFHQQLAEVGL